MHRSCEICYYGNNCSYAGRPGTPCEYFDCIVPGADEDRVDRELQREIELARQDYYEAWFAYIGDE